MGCMTANLIVRCGLREMLMQVRRLRGWVDGGVETHFVRMRVTPLPLLQLLSTMLLMPQLQYRAW